ncbi:MAG TPA: mannanase [Bacteroidota bacterium]|nr:mannanase [Bacteroidota bacterium]
MRLTLWSMLLAVSLILSSCSLTRLFRGREDFVRVRGTHFVTDKKPYYFAGANLWYACYMGSSGVTGDRPRLLRELDSLKSRGMDNLRILAASEQPYLKGTVKPVIQPRPGEVDEHLLEGLDFVLAEMAKRHMRAVLYLNNYWEWSGGMVVYNVWSGQESVDPYDTTKGWEAFMNFSAGFYSNQKANTLFRDYVRRLITRKNTVNGRLYREDPAIMSWQLANEPRPGALGVYAEHNLPAYYRWIDSTARFIHSLDTNHLVSTGSEGTIGSLLSPQYYLAAHKTPQVDYLTFHLWPQNWGWFDPKNIATTFPGTKEKALEYIGAHLALARQLQKPIVMEEFGLGRDGGSFQSTAATTTRDAYFELILRTLFDSARTGTPLAGYNVWAWGGEGRAQHDDGVWKEGDPFTGDPPQEPQGQNSVFSNDSATLEILGRYGKAMRKLRSADSLLTTSRQHPNAASTRTP